MELLACADVMRGGLQTATNHAAALNAERSLTILLQVAVLIAIVATICRATPWLWLIPLALTVMFVQHPVRTISHEQGDCGKRQRALAEDFTTAGAVAVGVQFLWAGWSVVRRQLRQPEPRVGRWALSQPPANPWEEPG